jgi:hypothetical protein
MGGMVNCKNFVKILYLISKKSRIIIFIQTKGVMATRLGEKSQINKKRRNITNQLNQNFKKLNYFKEF